MQIEYKITFGANTVTLTENIQPDGGEEVQEDSEAPHGSAVIPAAAALVQKQKELAPHRRAVGKGGSEADKIDPGGGKFGPQMFVISCPVVITYLTPSAEEHN